MVFRHNRLAWALPLSALLFGCAPKIGNQCTLSTDCSQLGDRLCDSTQPDGYCTIFNCEPDNCPDSICVGFGATLDPSCQPDGRPSRFERTFCMRPCSSDGDCRDQYECVTPALSCACSTNADCGSNGACSNGICDHCRVAEIVDKMPVGDKICIAKLTEAQAMTSHPTMPEVCGPGDAGPPWTPYTPDGGSTGTSTSSATGTSTSTGSATSSGSGTSTGSGMGGMGGMGGAGGAGTSASGGGKGGAGGA